MSFTAPDLSSNGGLLPAAKAERAVGIIDSISRCVRDWRNPLFIHHAMKDLVGQRVYQIACGYEDADDCDILRSDSVLKMSCGRRPGDIDLCPQPAMSRLENHVGHSELYEMGECELWIREPKDDLRIDRMSCTSFSANQFRVFLHAAAYILLWHVRHVLLKDTDAESWTVRTLQLRLLRSAVHITEQKTRIKIEFEDDHPQRKAIVAALMRA